MFLTKWTKRLQGIRFRLTLVYSTLFGLFICIFAFIISGQYLNSAREDFDSALLNYSIDLASEVVDQKDYKVALKVPNRELKKHFPFALGRTFFILREIGGEILSSSAHLEEGQRSIPYNKDLALKANYTHRFLDLSLNDAPFRAVNLKIDTPSGRALVLQVASPSDILASQRNRHVLINIITIPLLILISSIASFIIAGNALIPIQTVTDTANQIAAKNLSLRVPELNSNDEVSQLTKTFNTLLDRLEKSFEAQEHFVANASHQLNTPLAIIKGELDVLESKIRQPEDYQKFHRSLREELERLIDLVKNMLLVSRVESGLDSFVFHPVRIDEILLSTTSRLTFRAKEKRITLRFNISENLDEDSMEIMGEKQLLSGLFENLLDNAIKYSPEDSLVGIDILERDKKLTVSISDEGPGIRPEEYQEIANNRYHRGSKTLIPGTGIGLSIASQISAFHNASIIYAQVLPRGSRFSVVFSK